MCWDVICIGGGPAGTLAANLLANQGFRVLVVEKNPIIGWPVRCAGLITKRVLDMADIGEDVVQNEISGARIHAPNDTTIYLGGNKIHALVVDRESFDQKLAEKAENAGATIQCKCKVIDILKRDDEVVVIGTERIKGRYVIGADGARSIIARCLNVSPPKKYVHTLQTIGPAPSDSDTVDIYIGSDVAPGFFAWIIPVNEEAKIGLGVAAEYNVRQYFDVFLKRMNIKSKRATGGIIPLGLRTPLQQGNIALVGDAAGQVKPTSGGGLYPGLTGACMLAKSLSDALEGKKPFNYEPLYLKKMGSELRRGMFMHNRFSRMGDTKMNQIFAAADDAIIKTINTYGDIDRPDIVGMAILKRHPYLLRFLLPF